MADSYLPYKNPDTTDKKLDSESLTVGSDTVERERVQVAGKSAAEIQDVKNDKPANNAYGGISRLIPAGVILATITGSQTATGVVGSAQDVGARSLILQLTGTWSGTVTIEQSNDNSNWVSTILYDIAGSIMGGSGGVYTGITLNGIFVANIYARYVRVNVTSYSSGTIGINATLWGDSAMPSTIKIIPHSATSSGLIKQEDLAHASGDVGVFILSVRNDANAVRASADGDYQAVSTDKLGRQIVTTAPRGQRAKNAITLTSTTETTLLSAGGSGVFHDLTKLLIANTSGTDVRVDFRDATGGSVIFSVFAPAGQTVGVSAGDDPIPQTTANNNWTAQLSAAVTDVRIFAQAIKEA